MIKRLKKRFADRSLSQKINVIVLGAVICVMFVTQAALWYVFGNMRMQIMESYNQSMQLYATIVEAKLSEIERLSFELIVNPTVQSNLLNWKQLSVPETDQEDMEIIYQKLLIKNSMEQLLFNNIGWDGIVDHISVITENGDELASSSLPYLQKIEDLSAVLEEAANAKGGSSWRIYSESAANQLIKSRYIRSLKADSIDQPIGTLLLFVNLEKVIASSMSISPFPYGKMMITDKNSQIIYCSEPRLKEMESGELMANSMVTYGGQRFMVCNYQSSTGWTYLVLVPSANLFGRVWSMFAILFMVLLAVLCLMILASKKVSRQIAVPLSQLVVQMESIEKGDFKVDEEALLKNTHQDEVGALCRRFLIMIEKIDGLIKDNYIKQLTIKETQLRALQAQINPHFLYNVLESVNCMAVIAKQNDICVMVKSLSRLFRSAMSNQEMDHRLADELELIQSYVSIQKIRFPDRLDFSMSVDEAVTQCRIPKFLIQPLVENSVLYGVETTGQSCCVQLEVTQLPDDRIRISVTDDGMGMETQYIEDILAGVVKPHRHGIGIRNIKERIEMVYKGRGDMRIESEVGEGTCIIITVPLNEKEELYAESTSG